MGRDRIEVVMPLPSDAVRLLQTDYQSALEALLKNSRLRPAELEQALAAGNAPERFGGSGGPRDQELKALQKQYITAKIARSELVEARAADPVDEAKVSGLEDRLARSEIKIEDLKSSLFSQTLVESELLLAIALDDSPQVQKDANGSVIRDEDGVAIMGLSEQGAALLAIRAQLPHLADEIQSLEEIHDLYASKRAGLDDPEDLKRLLRGAGVLEFHIGVRSSATDVPIKLLRDQLNERGPRNTDSAVARWYPINSLEQWYDGDDPSTLEALKRDPVTYFSTRYGMVADEKSGSYYLLLYDSPSKSMTHRNGEAVGYSSNEPGTVDDLGQACRVSFGLDASRWHEDAPPHDAQREPADGDCAWMAKSLLPQTSTAQLVPAALFRAVSMQRRSCLSDSSVLLQGLLKARLSPEPISVSVLGPSIGQDNLWLVVLKPWRFSVIVVAIIMLCYYFFAGLVADLAFLMNAIMIFGVMAMIDGTFTLPGLAGIALTVGMAVDANVLVYERIREELVNNKEDLRDAIRLGFSKAASAILDGNITNLIVCFILFQTAATEVKGFALTLSIGVIATLFTTLFVARVIFTIYAEVFKFKSLPMLPTVIPAIHRLLKPNLNWVGFRAGMLVFSSLLAAASLVLFFSSGREILETEFRGGVSVVMTTRMAQAGEDAGSAGSVSGRLLLSRKSVEQAVHEIGIDNPDNSILSQLKGATVLTVGTASEAGKASQFQIKVANPPDLSSDENIDAEIVSAIVKRFGSELDVNQPVQFAGHDAVDHSEYTYQLDRDTLGEAIARDGAGVPIGEFRGGVAIVIDDIVPPIGVEEVAQRLNRMRNQPDFSQTAGRLVNVIGLNAADPTKPEDGFTSVAILVFDPNLDSFTVEVDTWDRELAQQEFQLVQAALLREASLEQVSSFSPKVAENLAASAIVAVVLSLIGMLVYIWFRFGSLRYSLCAIAALVFNVCICLGAIALSVMIGEKTFGSFRLLDEFRIDLNVVAGLLTIVGYSLNDTIVIMDRIRENRGKLSYATKDVVNNSINQTFSRTILTSGTTITSAVILYALGGTGIRPFAFTFLVGLIAATYSSVVIAAPLTWIKGATGKFDSSRSDGESGALLPEETATYRP